MLLLIAISQQTSRDDEYFRNTLNVREDLSQHPGVLKVQGVEPEFGKRLAAQHLAPLILLDAGKGLHGH